MIRYVFFMSIMLCTVLHRELSAQPESNMEVINSLLDKSVDMIFPSVENSGELLFEYNSPPQLKRFENRIVYALTGKGINVLKNKPSGLKLNYALDDVSVDFSEAFRESFLGGYKTERKIKISGSFILYENGKVSKGKYFNLLKADTLDYENINDFNNGFVAEIEKPGIPFFDSLLEPVIALGTVAVAIFLFFTVRSN